MLHSTSRDYSRGVPTSSLFDLTTGFIDMKVCVFNANSKNQIEDGIDTSMVAETTGNPGEGQTEKKSQGFPTELLSTTSD